MVRQLARFINMVQAEQALRQAAAELWPSGHKQIYPATIFTNIQSNKIIGMVGSFGHLVTLRVYLLIESTFSQQNVFIGLGDKNMFLLGWLKV